MRHGHPCHDRHDLTCYTCKTIFGGFVDISQNKWSKDDSLTAEFIF